MIVEHACQYGRRHVMKGKRYMKISKRALVLFVAVIAVMTAFSGCRKVDKWENEVIESNEELLIDKYDLVSNEDFLDFDNEVDFVFDKGSELEVSDLTGYYSAMTIDLNHPWFTIRKNKGKLYTIYSLSNERLMYLELLSLPTTGVTMIVYSAVEYPFVNEGDSYIYEYLLEKDYPEVIMESMD